MTILPCLLVSGDIERGEPSAASGGQRAPRTLVDAALHRSTSALRSSLPRSVFGNSSLSTICFGVLNAGSAAAQWRRMSSAPSDGARPQHDIGHHLLAIHLVRHADGARLDHLGPLHQHAVDLQRRDVDAAADDQVLGAAGQMQIALVVEEAEVAGLHPALAVDPDDAVVGERAVGVAAQPAELDRAHLARLQHLPFRADDGQAVIGMRPADRADAALLARLRGDPADLAAAVSLRRRGCRNAPRSAAIRRPSAAPSSTS